VWDFAGQAITHSAHHFFMSAGSVYLLVASNDRNDPARTDVPYWLRLIRAFATADDLTSPVIVVLNKAQTRPMRLDRLALQERYPFICAFVETECENGFGFDELRQALANAAARLPLVDLEFSLAWWSIRKRLEHAQQQSSHLDFASFQALCAAEGVVQEAQQRQFAEVFHALGVVVYFGADQRLRDAAVLNPQWVTRSVFKLLRTAVSDDGQALMSLDDVARVLNSDPSTMQRYIVDLMRRFDLAVPLDDEGRQWLVPQCLWAEQPPLGSEWDAADATRLRYSYAVLPAGLLPRFIARTYLLGGTGMPRWAGGVVLALRGARALVRLDVEGRPQIDVTVLGPAADRLELQGVVVADFNTIHADIPSLGQVLLLGVQGQPETFVPVQTLLADERRHRASAAQSAAGTVTLDATHELNRLNEPAARDSSTRRAQVFISYAHKDSRLKDELLNILKPLRDTNGLIDDWHDGLILPGQCWDDEIARALQQSDIVLMLISSDFIASDYIQQVEIRRAIERADRGQCTVVPVMLWLTDLEGQPIERFDAIPFKGKQPIGKYRPRSDAWYQVSRDLRRLLAVGPTRR
jgi:internalin A